MKTCYYSWCHEPVYNNTTMCKRHLEQHRNRQKKVRQKRFDAGLCTRCGKRPQREDGKNCQECFEKEQRKYQKTRDQHITKKRIRQGLCCVCGKRPPEPGMYCGKPRCTCKQCNEKRNRKKLEKRLSGNRYKATQRDNFTCQLCGETKGIIVHHIDGFGYTSGNPNDDINNLITLCRKCHSPITLLRRDIVNRKLACDLIQA